MWLPIESKFKWGHPSGIGDQKKKEIFPNPAITNVILAELSKKNIVISNFRQKFVNLSKSACLILFFYFIDIIEFKHKFVEVGVGDSIPSLPYLTTLSF